MESTVASWGHLETGSPGEGRQCKSSVADLSPWSWDTEVTGSPHSKHGGLHVPPHCANARQNRCQDPNSFPLENCRRPPERPCVGLSRRHDRSPGQGCRLLCECRLILDLQSRLHTSHRNSSVVAVVPSFLQLRFSCRAARTLLASKYWTPFLHIDRHEVLCAAYDSNSVGVMPHAISVVFKTSL